MKVHRIGLSGVCALAALVLATSAVAGGGRGGGGGGTGRRGGQGSAGGSRGGGQQGQGSQRRGGSSAGRGGASAGRMGGQGRMAGPGGRAGGYGGGGRSGSGGRGAGGLGQQHQYRHQHRTEGDGQGFAHRWQYSQGEEGRFSGVVVDEPGEGGGRGQARSILVRGEDGEARRVQLGPPWYLDDLGVAPVPGDRVEFIGAPDRGNQGALTAREIQWHGNTYRVRNEEGVPLWAGAARDGWNRYAGAWTGSEAQEFAGEIEGIEGARPGGRDMGQGVVLRLRAREREQERNREQQQERGERERERKRVHLGPYWYVEEALPGLRVGEQVTVRGASAADGAEQAIIASELVRNQERVRLRTAQGRPEWAGGWRNWDGWGPGSRYTSMFDPARTERRVGAVESVDEMTPLEGMGRGLGMTVRTRERERLRVHLGPSWFAEQAEIAPQVGDEVDVTGSLVQMNGKPVLMASEVATGGRRVRLRERDGTPVWAGVVPASPEPEPTTPVEEQPAAEE